MSFGVTTQLPGVETPERLHRPTLSTMRSSSGLQPASARGSRCARPSSSVPTSTVSVPTRCSRSAWSNSSATCRFELIQPRWRPSVAPEFLDAGHEGIHHVAFWTADYDKAMACAAEAGWTVVQSGDSGGATRSPISTSVSGALIVEITEQNEGGDGMNDRIRDAPVATATTDPVRSSDHDHLSPVAHRHLRAQSRSIAPLLLRRSRLRSRGTSYELEQRNTSRASTGASKPLTTWS